MPCQCLSNVNPNFASQVSTPSHLHHPAYADYTPQFSVPPPSTPALNPERCRLSSEVLVTELQIKLLKLLAILGVGDQASSENMYQTVATAMREAAKHGNTIGNALVYEAVRTITAIYPNPTLLQSGKVP